MQCNETTNVILILRARSRSRSLGLNDARAEDGLIDGLTDALMDGWIVPTATERDADGCGKASSSSSRTRVSFIGVDAEKRVEHPNPKRIINVNETNRIASRSSAAVWIARER